MLEGLLKGVARTVVNNPINIAWDWIIPPTAIYNNAEYAF